MEQYSVECVVVGAGVVGLAVARELAMAGKEVILVEEADCIGSGTSSRNSEVIHAGIYYPRDSLKALLCVEGKGLLYAYCEKYKIPHRRIGKLIVARDFSELSKLTQIQKHASENGVNDIKELSRDQIQKLEPALSSVGGLFSPSTGIIDSHALMLQLQADFEFAGGQTIYNTELELIGSNENGIQLRSANDGTVINAKKCVNSAGLNAINFCKGLPSFPKAALPQAFFAKGSYFSYQGKVPFSHLIYPVPVQGGLGTHLTLDMNNSAKFGPDVEWLASGESFDYKVNSDKKESFISAIQTYWPEVNKDKLVPDYSGIRPKISGPHDMAADFKIQGDSEHGIKGLVNLFGIESPGLTSSLAIAKWVERMLS